MGILFGASGTFKSFLALDLCLHLAHDMAWCGRKTNAGGVVYVAAEGGAGISRRVSAWHKQNKRMLATNFAVCVTPLLLTVEERIVALRDAISALTFKPSLIVVDTLSQTFAGDENSASDISDYLRLINLHLRSTFGASVLVIHHTGHSASERPRGSSALTANVDYLLGVYRPDAEGMSAQLEVLKQKDGDKLLAQHFDLTKIGDPSTPCDAIWVGGAGIVVAILQNGVGVNFTCLGVTNRLVKPSYRLTCRVTLRLGFRLIEKDHDPRLLLHVF
jgi:putative DNA primase/helicase